MVLDWAEKYRPKRLAEIVGNPSAIKALADWAEAWGSEGMKKKGALLVGRPGIGKTTAAHALALERGWSVIELNASDQRNADSIRDVATRGAVYETFTRDGEFRSAAKGERKLIILDEADNVSGHQDHGGYRAMVELVRETRQPVVLVANDYYEMRRKAPALESLCLVLKFEAPRQLSIAKRLMDIAEKEGMAASKAVVDSISANCGGDMRSAVNDLQTALTGTLPGAAGDNLAALGARDEQISPFDAVRKVISARDYKRARLATMDLDEEPGDFLTWMEHNVAAAFEAPADIDSAYQSLARADLFVTRANRTKAYHLWVFANDMMTAGVAMSRRAPLRPQFRYEFPSWIRQMGSSKGKRAIRRSLSMKLSSYTHSSAGEVLMESLPLYAGMFAGREAAGLRRTLLADLRLTEEEIAYLIDAKPDSDAVARIFTESSKIAALDGGPAKAPAGVAGQNAAPEKQERKAQRSLVDY
jgi:replication factor C large subunit